MMLTDLATACRKSGLPVVELPGWATRGHGPMSSVRSIICHHTAGPKAGELPSLGTVRDGRPGLEGPLAQLMLGRSGTVYVVAAGLCWHAGVVFDPATQDNGHAIGVEAEATGVDPWPSVQYAAYVRLCAALADHYGLAASAVVGHKEVASPRGRKSDPDFDMPAFRAALLAGVPGMELTDRLPDLYTPNGSDSITVGDSISWAAANAGFAKDRAAEARDAARAANATGASTAAAVASLKADVAGLVAKVDAFTVTGGTVDVDLLAAKVADVLAARLAG